MYYESGVPLSFLIIDKKNHIIILQIESIVNKKCLWWLSGSQQSGNKNKKIENPEIGAGDCFGSAAILLPEEQKIGQKL